MRYIGGKTGLLENILTEVLKRNCRSVLDVFSGSGVVSERFATYGLTTKSNDFLYFSYVLSRGLITFSREPQYLNLPIKNPIAYLNNLKIEDTCINREECFIWNHYSPHDNCNRMYFQENNALKIDIIRITIENWKDKGYLTDDEYFYLLSRLLSAVPYVSNIAGVYGAYLKKWETRSFKSLELVDGNIAKSNNKNNKAYNLDYKDFLKIQSADLLYADPPYNGRQYLPNYHILETIAKYDYPIIHGISGMRQYGNEAKSDFCKSASVASAFEDLIKLAKVNHIIISYNNEGLISTNDLTSLCKTYAKQRTFNLVEIPYRRYKCRSVDHSIVCEQLYIFEKK